MVTNRCNFACTYCYEKNRTGDMEWNTMKTLIDKMDEQWIPSKHCNTHCDMSLNMFGGEPMLNWEIIRKAIDYIDTKKAKFGIYILSNGSVWTPEIDEYLRKKSKQLGCRLTFQISIDGCESSHNETRIFTNKTGTYSKVVENIKKYREIFPGLILRETIVPNKIDKLFEDYKAISELANNISLTPIIEGDWFSALETAEKVIPKIFDLYLEQQKSRPVLFLSLLNGCIKRMNDEGYKYKGCHAGRELIGVTTEGDIYPCHRFIAYQEYFNYKIGDIFNGIDENSEKHEEICKAHFSQDECNKCGSSACNRCYATNMFLEHTPAALPKNGYCDFCRINQKFVNIYADKVIGSHKYTLEQWSSYKSPNTKRRAIQMNNGEKILGEDSEDLVIQTMVLLLKNMDTIINQNSQIINLLCKKEKEEQEKK